MLYQLGRDGREAAGRVGMCQESAVDSHYITVLGSADRELGVLADDDSKGSNESEAGSNRGTPGEHTSMHDSARYNMRARGCNYLGTSTEVG